MSALLHLLADPRTLLAAFEHVRKRTKAPHLQDHTGDTLLDFEKHLKRNLNGISQQLMFGTYRPDQYIVTDLPKPGGGHRRVYQASHRDRVVLSAVHMILMDSLDPLLSRIVYGYRLRRGLHVAIKEAARFACAGGTAVAADIHKFFDSIPQQKVLISLHRALDDDEFMRLPCVLLHNWAWDRGKLVHVEGVGQGLAISTDLANLHMIETDRAFQQAMPAMIRYSDNYLMCLQSRTEAEEKLALLSAELETRSGLKLKDPTEIVDLQRDRVEFLGWEFGRDVIGIARSSVERMKRNIEEHLASPAGTTAGPGARVRAYLDNQHRYFRMATDKTRLTEVEKWAADRLSGLRGTRLEPGPGGTHTPLGRPVMNMAFPVHVDGAGEGPHIAPPRDAITGPAPQPPRKRKRPWFAPAPPKEERRWLNVNMSQEQFEFVSAAIRTIKRKGGTSFPSRALELIAFDIIGTYAGSLVQNEAQFVNLIFAHMEETFGLRVIAIDAKKDQVVYGLRTLHEAAADDASAPSREKTPSDVGTTSVADSPLRP